MMRARTPRLLLGLLMALVSFAANRPADAAATEQVPPAHAPALRSGHGSNILTPQNPVIDLELGKGSLIRLDHQVATVFVANPETADVQVKSPTLIYVFAKAPGETVLYAVDADEHPLYSSVIRVTANLGRLREGLRSMMPDEPIAVTALEGAIVLSGTVSSAAHAEDARGLAQVFAQQSKSGSVINHLSVASPSQVNLRVRIVEVGRDTLRELGVNWSSLVQNSRFVFGLVTANPVTMTDNLVRNTATLGFNNGSNKVDAIIDALGQEGLVTVLAEPNLTALSGQTASFLAGGEFPVPIAQQAGLGTPTITVEFKKFGVALDFTPTILDSRRINLRVRPEVSQISDVGAVQLGNFNIPALSVRRAETSVELASGESFAIAGLLQNTDKFDVSKIPALGDLPVLGALFRSDRFKRSETELVILVTPYLVRPAPATALAAPTDPLPFATGPATVSGRASGTRLGAVAPTGAQAGGPMNLIGPAGFVLD